MLLKFLDYNSELKENRLCLVSMPSGPTPAPAQAPSEAAEVEAVIDETRTELRALQADISTINEVEGSSLTRTASRFPLGSLMNLSERALRNFDFEQFANKNLVINTLRGPLNYRDENGNKINSLPRGTQVVATGNVKFFTIDNRTIPFLEISQDGNLLGYAAEPYLRLTEVAGLSPRSSEENVLEPILAVPDNFTRALELRGLNRIENRPGYYISDSGDIVYAVQNSNKIDFIMFTERGVRLDQITFNDNNVVRTETTLNARELHTMLGGDVKLGLPNRNGDFTYRNRTFRAHPDGWQVLRESGGYQLINGSLAAFLNSDLSVDLENYNPPSSRLDSMILSYTQQNRLQSVEGRVNFYRNPEGHGVYIIKQNGSFLSLICRGGRNTSIYETILNSERGHQTREVNNISLAELHTMINGDYRLGFPNQNGVFRYNNVEFQLDNRSWYVRTNENSSFTLLDRGLSSYLNSLYVEPVASRGIGSQMM